MSIEAAERSRDTDGTTNVTTHLKRSQPRRQRCGTSTGAPSGGAGEIPGVVRATEDVIIRLPIGQHGWHVGLAHEDSASFLHTLCRRGVKIGLGLSKCWETRRGF
jgi:hypothetical protein